jgi:hypothetical protein
MDSPEPTDTNPHVDRCRQALIESLRLRFSQACQRRDAGAKQALFKEAVYLGIQPTLLFPTPPIVSGEEADTLPGESTQVLTLI